LEFASEILQIAPEHSGAAAANSQFPYQPAVVPQVKQSGVGEEQKWRTAVLVKDPFGDIGKSVGPL